MSKTKALDIFLNILIVLSTFWAVLMYFIGGPDILGSKGADCFKYFTTDSNILAALGSLVYLYYVHRRRPVPQWAAMLKFIGTVAVSITLLTVLFFLVPMSVLRSGGWGNAKLFFVGNVFCLHLSTPVLAVVSMLFLERELTISRKQAMLGVIPVAVYAVVYLTMVVFLQIWSDWYGFTFGGRYELVPVVVACMLLFAWGLSLLEWKGMQLRICVSNGEAEK